ncbi:MAG: glutamate--tRNA ligase [Patescibacteria group bacterium]
MNKNIITRFAPSPTGELHIGNARSALFEYLFAKHDKGTFLLRVEDTDRERFVEGATDRIIESLKWLGFAPDNLAKFPIQSERLDLYKKHAFELVKKGHAYLCTCSKEKLDEERSKLEKAGKAPRYTGTCRDAGIKIEDVEEGKYVIRMKMPKSGKIVVNDLIRGQVEFDLSLVDDQVLLKSDGYPTYHLAAIVDDHDMDITHVIRGEEWLSSTPKHLTLYKMFGWEAPEFAHLPMILAPDRTKLSKRHGATSVVEYKNLGYLPESLINFMAFLGWNPKDDREYFTLKELEDEFKIENVNKAPAIFNIDKLNNINEHYIVELAKSEKQKAKSLLEEFGVGNATDGEVQLIGRGGYKTLKEAADYILELRKEPEYKAEILIFKRSDKKNTMLALETVSEKLKAESEWTSDNVQKALEYTVIENGLSNGDVFWPIRVALSGEEKSPSPVELAAALGKEESLKRIQKAIRKLS